MILPICRSCNVLGMQVAPSDLEGEAATPLLEVELRLEAPALIFKPALPLPTPAEMDEDMDADDAAAEAALQLALSGGKATTSVVIAFHSWLDGFAAIGGLVPLLDGSEGGVSPSLLSDLPHLLPHSDIQFVLAAGWLKNGWFASIRGHPRSHSLLVKRSGCTSLLLISTELPSL